VNHRRLQAVHPSITRLPEHLLGQRRQAVRAQQHTALPRHRVHLQASPASRRCPTTAVRRRRVHLQRQG
jgi:hypothetical protein